MASISPLVQPDDIVAARELLRDVISPKSSVCANGARQRAPVKLIVTGIFDFSLT